MQQAIQALLVVEDQQAGHKKAVEPRLEGFGAFARSEAQAAACPAYQGNPVKCMEIALMIGEIWSISPGGQGMQFFGEVQIESRTRSLTVNLRDVGGSVLFSKSLEPVPGHGL